MIVRLLAAAIFGGSVFAAIPALRASAELAQATAATEFFITYGSVKTIPIDPGIPKTMVPGT